MTYRAQARNLARESRSHILGDAFEIETKSWKGFPVMFLPLPNIFHAGGCCWSILIFGYFESGSTITSSHELFLECGGLGVGRPSFENPALGCGWRNLRPRGGVACVDRALLHHLFLRRRFILLLCHICLGSWPFCALDERSMRRVGGVWNASQGCSRSMGGHDVERIVW